MKKKLLLLFAMISFIIGCENTMNTPHNKVEQFLGKYQNMEKNVLQELDTVVEKDKYMNKNQKEEYKKLLEKQYQNLSYKITKEEIEEESAIVEVEIEVINYQLAINQAKENYLKQLENKKENRNIEEDENFQEIKIKEMKKATMKTKHNITFYLYQEKGIWKLEDLTEDVRKKIHGLY